MASKSALLAAARSGGSAAVRAAVAANPWPGSVRSASGDTYVFRSAGVSSFSGRVLGYYHWRDRCVALTLEDAKKGSFA